MVGFKLKDTIFEKYFARVFHTNDLNKDQDGKGVMQHFVEILAEDLDDNLIGSMESIIDDTLVPADMKNKFIPYLEKLMGIPVMSSDVEIRRRVLERGVDILKHKGTLRGYKLIYRALGFTDVELIPVQKKYGFDSDVTLDDTIRRFDMGKCYTCAFYTINLIGNVPMTDDMYRSIKKAREFVEPIYARIYSYTENGQELRGLLIYIQDNGDLVYETKEENLEFDLLPNGDLTVSGPNEGKYVLINGDLILKTDV